MEPIPVDLHFPFAGLDVSQGVGKQPNRPSAQGKYARTSAAAQNVRAYDVDGRARGGSRSGLVKYISNRPANRLYATQFLGKLVITGSSPVQPSQSGRQVLLVAVSAGNVYYLNAGETTWTTATNNTGETPALNATGLVRAAAYGDKLYFVDGTNYCYFDGTTGTVEAWTASAGSMPVDGSGNKARHICLWRGRIVLSGLLLNPNQLFASKVGDPRDFNYAPATPVPADSAWSSSTGPQGNLGDVITTLIPYTDDLLVIGMDSSMAIFRGDPMAGGSIDNVTTTIGMAWGEPWCMDPTGRIFFFSNRTGIFTFVPGQLPQRISQPVDSLLLSINTGEYGVRMMWNDRFKGMHVFITLLAEQFATTHYFWEQQADAWWQDVYDNTNHNPLCCVVFDGNDANDRVALIGSWDGYIRSVSSTTTDDDGTPISSRVMIGPFLTQFSDAVMLKEIQAVMAADSGDVTYAVYTANTAEEALDATPYPTGTFGVGRSFTKLVQQSANAAYIELTSVAEWAMESIRCMLGTLGKVRQRGRNQ